MYEYTPGHTNKKARAVCLVLFASAVMLIITSALGIPYSGLLQLCAFLLAVAGVMVCTRYLLTHYTYCVIWDNDSGEDVPARPQGADLTVSEIRGNRSRVVCRVAVRDGVLRRADRTRNLTSGIPVYDYCPDIRPDNVYIFFPPAADGVMAVRFCPDEKTVSLLRALGASCPDSDDER